MTFLAAKTMRENDQVSFLVVLLAKKKASGPKADQVAQSTIRSLYSKSFLTVTVSKLGAVYMAQKRAQIRPKGVKSLIVQ